MMNTKLEQQEEKPFRFSMRTLLLVTTGVCVLGAILTKTLEPRYQISVWVIIVIYTIAIVLIYRSYQKNQRRMATVQREGIIVKVDEKWIRRIKSRWFFLIPSLTGVAVTSAPLGLLWCGGGVSEYGLLEWIVVPTCLLVIYFVPGFYMELASEVIYQLMKQENLIDPSAAHAASQSSESRE